MKYRVHRRRRSRHRALIFSFALGLVILAAITGVSGYFLLQIILYGSPLNNNSQAAITGPQIAVVTPTGNLASWPAFAGGGARTGINGTEKTITPANVGKLALFWQTKLPDVTDSSPVFLPDVQTSTGRRELLFLTTKTGSLLAIDAANGSLLWKKDTSGKQITNSTPVLDPTGKFVYSAGLDGKVHKYAVATGEEMTSGGWPITISLIPQNEKISSSLNITKKYLYVVTSGYLGANVHYEGHIVAIQLDTGRTTVFNAICSQITKILTDKPDMPNYCPDSQGGIWGRAGAVIDPATGNVFATSGNGPYNANTGGNNYGDSILELSPDLTTLIDTYTPKNFAQMAQNNLDLGSSAPVMLPIQLDSATPFLLVQASKDLVLRLINRQDLSGTGQPGHVGGELQAIKLVQACPVNTQPVAWNDANHTTWVFVANDCNFSAYKVVTNQQGQTTLHLAYSNANTGSSPFIANNLLFLEGSGILSALDPTTGKTLWDSTLPTAGGTIGGLHWESPLVINGIVYVPDEDGMLTAYGIPR